MDGYLLSTVLSSPRLFGRKKKLSCANKHVSTFFKPGEPL